MAKSLGTQEREEKTSTMPFVSNHENKSIEIESIAQERNCVESSLNCFSFKFFVGSLIGFGDITDKVQCFVFFSRSLILPLFSLFLSLSTSSFCQLKLVIKLREQSSFVLEGSYACFRTYSSNSQMLYYFSYISFSFFFSFTFFLLRQIHAHHPNQHHNHLHRWVN